VASARRASDRPWASDHVASWSRLPGRLVPMRRQARAHAQAGSCATRMTETP
jgi:hypothetical protein